MTDSAPEISIVSPVYGSPELIAPLCERLRSALKQLTEKYEIILVFDCSPDDGWARIVEQAARDRRVRGVRLSRNFGQHAAITAGLAHGRGGHFVVMDCDLQDQPEEIPKLMSKAQEGFKVVLAQRQSRRDGPLKRLTSQMFYTVLNLLAGARMDYSVANFGVYERSVIDAYLTMGDSRRFFPLFVQWTGFRTTKVPVRHAARPDGKSGYNLRKRLDMAFDIIVSFSNKPLQIMISTGFTIAVLALLLGFFYLIGFFLGAITEPGFTSLILSLWLIGGVLMVCMGVLGVYVGRTFDETKGRPTYVVDEVVGVPAGDDS